WYQPPSIPPGIGTASPSGMLAIGVPGSVGTGVQAAVGKGVGSSVGMTVATGGVSVGPGSITLMFSTYWAISTIPTTTSPVTVPIVTRCPALGLVLFELLRVIRLQILLWAANRWARRVRWEAGLWGVRRRRTVRSMAPWASRAIRRPHACGRTAGQAPRAARRL